MSEYISFCGISCHACPAYIATQEDSQLKRREVAEQWSAEFKMKVTPDDINCDGCHAIQGQRLSGHCLACTVRKCGQQKGVNNCALCSEYPCAVLDEVHKMIPIGKEVLEQIRQKTG